MNNDFLSIITLLLVAIFNTPSQLSEKNIQYAKIQHCECDGALFQNRDYTSVDSMSRVVILPETESRD